MSDTKMITVFFNLDRHVPAALHDGINELIAHPIRVSSTYPALATSSSPTHLPLTPASSSASSPYSLAWNCIFLPTSQLDKRALHISPSYQSNSFLINIFYHPARTSNAFRALGHVLAIARSPHIQTHDWINTALTLLARSEKAHFQTIGTMVDCSRNGVLNVPSTKFLLRILALQGYNMLQLYTEDTYNIPNEPFFGYLRGGYTFQDTKDIDDYAFQFGIELVPCIQTLGHLGQVLQWPRFLSLRDTSEVLLAAPSHPPTATLVAQMLDAAMAPVRSKRIHLGMDETHGLAMGRFHQLYNAREGKDASEVFVKHLQVVQNLCQERGIKGMIWSDMLFCLHARQNSLLGYYDSSAPPTSTATSLPKETDLVFWDYYHLSSDSYRQRLQSHRDLMNFSTPSKQQNSAASAAASAFTAPFNALRGRTRSQGDPTAPSSSRLSALTGPPASPNPPQAASRNLWMAAGSWTWSRFWTALPFTFATVRASMSACKESSSGVDNVFLTIWGDEGNEVDLWSSLPAWTYYAEHGFRKIDGERLSESLVQQYARASLEEQQQQAADGSSALSGDSSSTDQKRAGDGSEDTAVDKDVELDEGGEEEGEEDEYLSAAEAEVDVDLLRAKFDALCGGNFDDFVVASRVDDVAPEQQTVDDRIHFAPNTSKWLLWEEPFFGFVSPSSALSGVDLQQHYEALAAYLLPRISYGRSEAQDQDQNQNGETASSSKVPNPSTHPLNARLVLPYLLAQALSLKAGLRREMHEAYRARQWDVLRVLGGRGETSRLGRLRVAVEKLWRYHREMWMSMYKPFGWETVELRYGGFRARLDTMHARIARFLDHVEAGGQLGVSLRNPPPNKTNGARSDAVLLDVSSAVGVDPSPVQTTRAYQLNPAASTAHNAPGPAPGTQTEYESEVTELPELDVELELVYGSADQLLDYHRVSRPTYC
ncbi:hypothetical protein OC861_000127 [Tilletia horrida]|nr:hypothetical protein OC845_000214 [Tilletia horrida]KAK0570178.1 hypothetical protein OC861_000127 [Tilletia horrida]